MSKIKVNTKFDAGSIEVINIDNPQDLRFKIRRDTKSEFKQWFYFQLNGISEQEIQITLSELSTTAYPKGFEDYSIAISYDNQYWTRLPTQFDGDNLTFSLNKSSVNSVYIAYFEPYSYQRHLELIGYANQVDGVTHQILGQTLEGRNIDLLVVGDEETAKHKIWVIARQHPGETMAEWFMEGLIHKLLDEQDSTSKTLLKDCVFYLVPNMNPDGAYHGNLRVNTVGTNLNREWLTPSLDKSPEVYYVREKMCQTGVDMFFDIHGDESIPYIFTAGCQENKSFSKKQAELAAKFTKYYELVNPDYQTIVGYKKGRFSTETSTLATNWVGDKFDCLSFTLEMPFKDNSNLPDDIHGWDGRRSSLLGESLLTAINLVLGS
jgi:murein tripeptide amidase MpaA